MMKEKYFYMWRHPYSGMTCYGISSNPDGRIRKYEGHNGFNVKWDYLISGSQEHIDALENDLKAFVKKLGVGFGDYEWIQKEVDYASIVDTVEYLSQGKSFKKIISD